MPIQVLIRHLDADAIAAFDADLACEPYEGEPYERLFLVSVRVPDAPEPLATPEPGQRHSPQTAKDWIAKHAKWERDKHAAEKHGAKRLNALADKDAAEGERVKAEREAIDAKHAESDAVVSALTDGEAGP